MAKHITIQELDAECAEWYAWFFRAKQLYMHGDPKEFDAYFLNESPYRRACGKRSQANEVADEYIDCDQGEQPGFGA